MTLNCVQLKKTDATTAMAAKKKNISIIRWMPIVASPLRPIDLDYMARSIAPRKDPWKARRRAPSTNHHQVLWTDHHRVQWTNHRRGL